MASAKDSETACESPLCDVRFEQTGLAMSPRRFCSDTCKQQASLIRRVAALLAGLEDSQVLEILRMRLSPCQPSAIKRQSMAKRMGARLLEIKAQLKRHMHGTVAEMGAWPRSVVRGWFNYHAVPGNSPRHDS